MAHLQKKQRYKDGKATGVWLDKQGKPRWCAQVFVGRHPTTRRHQFISKTCMSKKEALEWVHKQEGLKHKNIRPATTRETFAAYLRRWLDVYGENVRDSTIYNIRKTLGKWVLDPRNGTPPIGGKQLRKLTYEHLEKLYHYMVGEGKQPRAIRYLHGTLKRALKAAVKTGELPRNPAEFVTLPKDDPKAEINTDHEDQKPVECLDREESERFLAAAKQDRHSALWHVLLLTGIRPGEALALKWRDVDLKKRVLRVRATLTRLGVEGWKLTKPKTERARRDVHLMKLVVQELQLHQSRQEMIDKVAAGKRYHDHGFVFATQHGSPHSLSNLSRRRFRWVMEKAGLGEFDSEVPEKPKGQPGPEKHRRFRPSVRMYALRHTFATLMLADGEKLLVVSRLLGHTNIQTTADLYSFVLPEQREEATGRLDAMFPTT